MTDAESEKFLKTLYETQLEVMMLGKHHKSLPPWPPERLVGALQDNIHRDVPEYRVPVSVKVGVPMKELTSSLDVELENLFSHLMENQQPLEPEFQKVLDDSFWELLSE